MIEAWILLWVLFSADGVTSGSQEFGDEAACRAGLTFFEENKPFGFRERSVANATCIKTTWEATE